MRAALWLACALAAAPAAAAELPLWELGVARAAFTLESSPENIAWVLGVSREPVEATE